MSVHDIDAEKLIKKLSEELKKVKEIKEPEWGKFVKTGRSRERQPKQDDWWYVRSAAILRKIYLYGPIGVSKLRVKYGGKKNRGHKPERFYKGSGNIIRKILQQLEAAGFVKKEEKSNRKGRICTSKGKSFLNKLAK